MEDVDEAGEGAEGEVDEGEGVGEDVIEIMMEDGMTMVVIMAEGGIIMEAVTMEEVEITEEVEIMGEVVIMGEVAIMVEEAEAGVEVEVDTMVVAGAVVGRYTVKMDLTLVCTFYFMFLRYIIPLPFYAPSHFSISYATYS